MSPITDHPAGPHQPLAPAPRPPATASVVPGISAIFLLGGAVSPSPLATLTGRHTLRLPVAEPGSDLHQPLLDRLLDSIDLPGVPVRLLLDRATDLTPWHRPPRLLATQDSGELRGAGGALRDAVEHIPHDAVVVAMPAAQLLLRPLSELLDGLLTDLHLPAGVDAVIGGSADGTPGTVLVVRAGALRCIKPVGFVDLKEQALPLLARRGHLRGRRFQTPFAVSIRTASQYLHALQLLQSHDPNAASPGFRLIEAAPASDPSLPTRVSPTALVHDSVVLAGATIGPGAVVVRSLVCPGAAVPEGAVVVDSVVEGSRSTTRAQKSAREPAPEPAIPHHKAHAAGKEALA